VAKLHALAAQIPNGILMPRAEPRGVEHGRQSSNWAGSTSEILIGLRSRVHTGGPMDYKQMGRQYEGVRKYELTAPWASARGF